MISNHVKVNVNGCRNIDSQSYKYNDGKAIIWKTKRKRGSKVWKKFIESFALGKLPEVLK